MSALNVLLTCANSQVSPSVIQHIKSYPYKNVTLYGIDAIDIADVSCGKFADHFTSCPMGNDPKYIEFILDYVKKNSIDFVFPGSDEEAIALSSIKDELAKLKCNVMASTLSSVQLLSDKYRMLLHLAENGIRSSPFTLFNDPNHLVEAAKIVGYPHNLIVLKPRRGRGSKVVKIIDDDLCYKDRFENTTNAYITLNEALQYFRLYPDKCQDYLLMEYLPGEKYSIDCLVSHSRLVCGVSRSNGIHPKLSPPTQLAKIVWEEDIFDYAINLIDSIEVDYFLQIEIGRDASGKLSFIEANPRLDATLPITLGVGVNFYHELISYSEKGEFSNLPICPNEPSSPSYKLFCRYWSHAFFTSGQK